MTRPQPPLADYAMVGDCRSAALIAKDGSIDWLCWPQFDSPSFLNRLLDQERGGHFTIAPAGAFSVRRAYRPSTVILATDFDTAQGRVRLTDLMPVLPEAEKRTCPMPLRSLLRLVEGLEGTVDLAITFKPRPDDARLVPTIRRRQQAGYAMDYGGRLLHLASRAPLSVEEGALTGRLTVKAGDRHPFWLAYSEDAPAVYPCLSEAEAAIEATQRFWTRWADACAYQGPHREAVLRSALTLKLLSFAPSGAIVAAPTTSLPELIGGSRNWDYRYCWLRDASLTAELFFRLGFSAEAVSFVQWLSHATALTHPALQVLYDVFGESSVPEVEAAGLRGYQGARPVRIGNQAHRQYQLDIYGELLHSLLVYVEAGHPTDREMRRRLVKMADLVAAQWHRPDHGIWEIRQEPRHYVHSKVMCWVALDRAERIARRLGIPADLEAWRRVRDEIQRSVLACGYSQEQQSFVQAFDSVQLDATALTFPQTGMMAPDDPRCLSTVTRIRRVLGRGDLVYRYLGQDGLPGGEGAFLPCSFWLVEALALAGDKDEAAALFDRLQRRANDVGLYSEEMDPATGEMLGNFPQALTHIALTGAALRLD